MNLIFSPDGSEDWDLPFLRQVCNQKTVLLKLLNMVVGLSTVNSHQLSATLCSYEPVANRKAKLNQSTEKVEKLVSRVSSTMILAQAEVEQPLLNETSSNLTDTSEIQSLPD